MIAGWPCPAVGSASTEEYALVCDHGRSRRLLIVPALFDEANRLRRFTVEAMRHLDAAGIDAMLPDLPGTNESLVPLAAQSLDGWREAMAAAARHFRATHVLALRGGALVAPDLPGWAIAPVGGAAILRQMIRVRVIAAREAGREERAEALLEQGRQEGLVLAGHELSAGMIAALHAAAPATLAALPALGPALWLRAEPGEDPDQSRALADWIAAELAT